MAEKKINWTSEQKRAITERGSDLLVSASAGTGKTAVLSGRCVDILSDKALRSDVFNMLILTFTEMAAEQMRSRIADQIKAMFIKTSDKELRRHLRSQLILLPAADISTIHSFCKRLITEHFYKLGLDPTFGIIDGDEQKLLKAEILEKTIEWAWQQSNLVQAFEQLLYRRDLRSNEGFAAKIIETSDFLDSVVSRQKWYERAVLLAGARDPFAETIGRKQKRIISDKLHQILTQIRYAQKLYDDHVTGGDWFDKYEESLAEPVEQCIRLSKDDNWDALSEQVRSFVKPRVTKPVELSEGLGELIRKTIKQTVDSFAGLRELAVINPDYLERIGNAAGLQTKVVIELVKKFDQLYTRAKGKINCLDFADLEHFALKLLADEKSSDEKLLPSQTALAFRRRYNYIFVDEYQDINDIQQAILTLLSSEGNVFVVGDVKQSIYAFRGAKPEIFTERLKPALSDSVNGLRVDLNANFRSAKGILDFVNKIFGRIMTSQVADIDYDEAAKLKPASELRRNSPVVELHILDETETDRQADNQVDNGMETDSAHDEKLEAYTARQHQAIMIARKIRQMVGADTGKAQFEIYDKHLGKKRAVEYGDIAILLRSPAKRVNDYVEMLHLADVPVSCDVSTGYFETTEITDLLSLLKVLDNPQRDIELAAMLRGPFFNVSDSELAKIKIHGKTKADSKNFYDCFRFYAENGCDIELNVKLKESLNLIERWRTLARQGSLADLIWLIYRESGIISFVSALPSGRQRRANLLKLHDRAIQFEGFVSSRGAVSLTRFVDFIEKLCESGRDWSTAEPATVGDSVRIISIHKSKGLEFPVVFLAELNARFNRADSQNDFLIDSVDTLGLQIIDRSSNSRLSSLAHQVIAEEKLSANLAEEMRILYVATTRARERLILTASHKKNVCRDIVSSGFYFGEEPAVSRQLRRCRSPLEWILYGLSDQKSLHNLLETSIKVEAVDDNLFEVKIYSSSELESLCEYIEELKKSKRTGFKPAAVRAEPKLLSQVKKSLNWRYGFEALSVLPAKQSVSQMTHYSDEYVEIDYSRALSRKPKAVVSAKSGVWEKVDARLIGEAVHLVISKIDLTEPVTESAIKDTIESLLSAGNITRVVAEYINTQSIEAFFAGRLGKEALKSENKVWREWPFTFSSQASEQSQDETIVIQGIIDMLIQTPKGLIVIDFKTDNLNSSQITDRAEFYRKQLELYGRAAGGILKVETVEKWIYFLTPACEFEIK